MATLTIEITDDLKLRLDHEAASGGWKDANALVAALLETAIRLRWHKNAEKKIDEALDEVDRGDVALWAKGDCTRLGREYLQEKRARQAQS